MSTDLSLSEVQHVSSLAIPQVVCGEELVRESVKDERGGEATDHPQGIPVKR